MVLKKTASLYERDEKGKLIPKEVELEVDEKEEEQLKYKGEKISITPMPRGKLRKIFADMRNTKDESEKDFDGEIILEHCKNPEYTKEEIPYIKPALTTCIVNTIFRESGLKVNTTRKKALEDVEDDFAKN